MTHESKRTLERKVNELDSERTGPTLADVWKTDLQDGEGYELTTDEWEELLK